MVWGSGCRRVELGVWKEFSVLSLGFGLGFGFGAWKWLKGG